MPAPLNHTMVIAPVNKLEVGEHYEKVPPHITVLPWMDFRGEEPLFIERAAEICSNAARLAINLTGTIKVGPNNDIVAQSVSSTGLRLVHLELLELAEDLGIQFQNPEWLGDGYQPHISDTVLSEALFVRALTVIMNRSTNPPGKKGIKVVEAILPLGENL